ncbi:MAG: hypothetical protein NTY08_18425 [Proteobacteria bacterium]|nr:hypothetical protein [Pseudomonadota bacterium]
MREKALIPPGLYLCPPTNWMPIKLSESEIGSVMEPVILFRENIYRRVNFEILLGFKHPRFSTHESARRTEKSPSISRLSVAGWKAKSAYSGLIDAVMILPCYGAINLDLTPLVNLTDAMSVVPTLESIMNGAIRPINTTLYAYGLGFAAAKISMDQGLDLSDLILENARPDVSRLKELCARVGQQDFDLWKDCAGDAFDIESEININATKAGILDGALAATKTSKIKISEIFFQGLLTDLPAYQILTVALHPAVDEASKVDIFNDHLLGTRDKAQHQSALTTIVGDLVAGDFVVPHFEDVLKHSVQINRFDRVSRKMANHHLANVRKMVAEKANVSREIMLKLAEDEDVYVRITLSENESISPQIATMLARDKVAEVREAVVPHKMLPANIIAQLLFDFDLGVMLAASHRFREVRGYVDLKRWCYHLFGIATPELVIEVKRLIDVKAGILCIPGFAKMLRLIYRHDAARMIETFHLIVNHFVNKSYKRFHVLENLSTHWCLVFSTYLRTLAPDAVAKLLTSDSHNNRDCDRAERFSSRLFLEAAVSELSDLKPLSSKELLDYLEKFEKESRLRDKAETFAIAPNRALLKQGDIDGALAFPGLYFNVPRHAADLFRIEAQLGTVIVKPWFLAPKDSCLKPIVAIVDDNRIAVAAMQITDDGFIEEIRTAKSKTIGSKMIAIVERQLLRRFGKSAK